MTVPDCRTLVVTGATGSVISILDDQYFAFNYWGNYYWGNLWWGVEVFVTGTPTERTLTIEAEDRTLSILACTDGG